MAVLLEADGLTRVFGGLTAVRDVSFSVVQGEILGIIGPNGAGKTTLFAMIAGSLPPTRGTIRFQGREITRLPVFRRVQQGIIRTHQIPRPFRSLTVFENVLAAALFGSTNHRRSRQDLVTYVSGILEMVGLLNLAKSSPLGLSVGNQKRLELARALATEPKLLLLDEICGGLTEAETDAILRLIRHLRQQKMVTVIYIEHNMRAVMSVSDRILALDAGRIIAEGAPKDIQRHPAVIEAYLGRAVKSGDAG